LPESRNCMLVVVDVQERLCPAMSFFDEALVVMRRALQTADILDVDTLVTEQYPRGLGATIPAIMEVVPSSAPVLAKTTFSCWGADGFLAALEARGTRALVLIGMETHVCVQQTALEALERGYEVVLLGDAVCSRRPQDREFALGLMRASGVSITTFEALVFSWLADSKHPCFKAVSALVK